MKKIGDLISSFIDFINDVLVPLVFAVALIVFLFGVFRFFIAGAANPEKRKQGSQLIIYSIIGFAVMISVWGLVNLLVGTFGFDNLNRPCLPTFGSDSNGSNCSGNNSKSSNDYVLPQDVYDQARQESQGSQKPQPGLLYTAQ